MNAIEPKLPPIKSPGAVLRDRIKSLFIPPKPETVTCRGCGTEIEADRERCPTCGFPQRLREAM